MRFLLSNLAAVLTVGTNLLLASMPAQAQSTYYNDRATFLAHTAVTTTLDFEGLAPDKGTKYYSLPAGLTLSGVNFNVDPAFTHNVLFAIGKDSYYPGNSVFSSQNTQAQAQPDTPTSTGDLFITFSTPVTAIGLDLGDKFNLSNTDTFTLSNGETFTRPTGSGTSLNFVGLTSPTPITSLDIREPNDYQLNIDNFTFGGVAPIPEAATAVSLGFLLLVGGVSLCCVKRRTVGRE